MARPKNVSPNRKLTTTLPEELMVQLDLILFSEFEGRIPVGAYQEFLSARIREFLVWRKFPLEPFGFPEGFFVTGPDGMIEKLEQRLKEG